MSFRKSFLLVVGLRMMLTLGAASVTLGEDVQEHPLMPAIRLAYDVQKHIDADVKDYTCTTVNRERIGNELSEFDYVQAKFRQQPFSVYMALLKPESKKGQEAIYVAGRNDGCLLGHGCGLEKLAGTVKLQPTGDLAMKDTHYPITETGMRNLVKRFIEVGENDARFAECEVKFFKNAKVNGVSTTCIEVVHPRPRHEFLFHIARLYIDDEQRIPVRYVAYDWPKQPGGQPDLIEEYSYLNVKLNVGLTDADFDPKNPAYQYP